MNAVESPETRRAGAQQLAKLVNSGDTCCTLTKEHPFINGNRAKILQEMKGVCVVARTPR